MDAQMIDLDKISPEAITPIREVNKDSNNFKLLEHVINLDNQKYPIVIRKLTEQEKSANGTVQGAEYGIIDGHHRYEIAKANSQDKILATIVEYTPSDEADMKVEDVKMALRMNSAIPMTALQKGEVLYRLNTTTGKKIDELGDELFGLAKSMAYRYLNTYKKHNKISTVTKKRTKTVNAQMIVDINAAWEKIPHEEQEIDTGNATQCVEQLKNIESLEKQLAKLRKILMSQNGVQEILDKE